MMNVRSGRRGRAVAVAGAVVGAVVAAAVLAGFVDPTVTGDTRRDRSGLLVVTGSRDGAVPEDEKDAYAAYDALTEANPDDFGYASPNVSNGTVSVAVVTERGRDLLASFSAGQTVKASVAESPNGASKREAALAAAARFAPGLGANDAGAPTSRTATEKVKDDLIGWGLDPAFADAGLWATEVERSSGKVLVTVEKLTPELASAIVATYGTERVVVTVEDNPHMSVGGTRQGDTTSFWGGAKINVPIGACTDGFSWRLSGGIPAMVTAGHCAPSGGSVSSAESMGSVASGTHENYALGVGTVTVPGYSGYHGDGAVIQIAAGKSSAPWIYRGSATSSTGSQVVQMWPRRALDADRHCYGGMVSGESCGWTVDGVGKNLTVYNGYSKKNEVARNVVTARRQGACPRLGDSGGSVFVGVTGGMAAKGIHNGGGGGGSDNYGGLTDPCSEYFTDIWDIYYGLPGYLAL